MAKAASKEGAMEITEIKVFLKDSPDKKLKAYVTVTFDNAFVVRNIKIIEGTVGLVIAMPSRKIKRSWSSFCHHTFAGFRAAPSIDKP